MKIRAIITGATGMVGEGVLQECLLHPDVESVLSISRRPCGMQHAKLKEILHQDFSNFSAIEQELSGYNAAFLCMGVSSVGMSEEKYRHLTYDLTMALARTLSKLNPDMTICYVSGMGTDSSEKGRVMWARVKGKTENDLLGLPFRSAYMFRPGFMKPTKGLRNTHAIYRVLDPLFPLANLLFPRALLTLKEVGLAMINSVGSGPEKRVLEIRDIAAMARKS
ncbi:MAG: NAD-dependent epimerase/dehydratase family protein [Nitrospirota bacterium]|nr:NAD-dependent epimerase/dehydratase family protein [Nitrospirota bacterium]